MAQTVFINVTLDPATQLDAASYYHTAARGVSASGGLTISIDTALVITRTRARSAILTALKALEGGAELTA